MSFQVFPTAELAAASPRVLRKLALPVLGTCGLLSSLGARAQRPLHELIPASSAGAFVDSVGINVHFNYYGSIYTNRTPLVLARLKQLGITHLRDALCWQGNTPENTYYILHRQLGALGYKTDYIAYIHQPAIQLATYPSLVNDMEAIEPANEYDISGDPNWVATITAQQSELYSTLRAVAPKVAVLAPSLAYPFNAPQLGNVSHISEAGNLHGYFGGNNPADTSTLLDGVQANNPHQPAWVTETGYFGKAGPAFGSWGVTPEIQAIYSPRLLLNYWNSGATRTYLYELADDLEPGENSSDYHWGLLDSNAQPKPAFTAIANLHRVLRDPAPASGAEFTPKPLPLSISISSPTVRYTLFEKRDGSYYLAIWNEVPSYDPATGKQLTPAAQSATIHLERDVLSSVSEELDPAPNPSAHPIPFKHHLTILVTDKVQIISWVPR